MAGLSLCLVTTSTTLPFKPEQSDVYTLLRRGTVTYNALRMSPKDMSRLSIFPVTTPATLHF